MTIRVAVVGAAGRMGSTVCQAVEDAEGLELVARLDVGDTLDAEHLAGADVEIDRAFLEVETCHATEQPATQRPGRVVF